MYYSPIIRIQYNLLGRPILSFSSLSGVKSDSTGVAPVIDLYEMHRSSLWVCVMRIMQCTIFNTAYTAFTSVSIASDLLCRQWSAAVYNQARLSVVTRPIACTIRIVDSNRRLDPTAALDVVIATAMYASECHNGTWLIFACRLLSMHSILLVTRLMHC